jgi:hypothetical protein
VYLKQVSVHSNVSGSFGPNYLFEIKRGENVNLDGVSSVDGITTSTNLTSMALFPSGQDNSSNTFSYKGSAVVAKTKWFTNLGTGNPKVHVIAESNGITLASNTGRLDILNVNGAVGADGMQISQENLAGRWQISVPNYTGGQTRRFDCRKANVDVTARPSSGSWEVGDYARNIGPAELGSASSKYIILGWARLTTGSGHVLNTDWFECRALTGN